MVSYPAISPRSLKKIRLFYIQYLQEAFWGQNIKHMIPKSAVNMPTIPRRFTLRMKAARRSNLTARNKSPVPARSGWWNKLQQFKRTLWHTRGKKRIYHPAQVQTWNLQFSTRESYFHEGLPAVTNFSLNLSHSGQNSWSVPVWVSWCYNELSCCESPLLL